MEKINTTLRPNNKLSKECFNIIAKLMIYNLKLENKIKQQDKYIKECNNKKSYYKQYVIQKK